VNPTVSKTVLLVEDDDADVLLIERAFKKAGVNATLVRVSNGDEAVAYLDGQPPYIDRARHPLPSVVLMDIKLPRRSGLEVLEWLRGRADELRRLPVVMLTSSAHSRDITRAYDLGANSYLMKPDTTEELTQLAAAFNAYWLSVNQAPAGTTVG
jgi:CheY-like chemotaxis protein